jgi:hypothetical protein
VTSGPQKIGFTTEAQRTQKTLLNAKTRRREVCQTKNLRASHGKKDQVHRSTMKTGGYTEIGAGLNYLFLNVKARQPTPIHWDLPINLCDLCGELVLFESYGPQIQCDSIEVGTGGF